MVAVIACYERMAPMTVLEERGLFWWDTGPLPEPIIAPTEHLAGVLKIEDDGRAVLELDGWFPNKLGPAVVMEQGPLPSDKRIHGLLRDSNKEVLLIDLQRSGGRFSTGGISFDRFVASSCLVSNVDSLRSRKLTFNQIEISLKGLEEWLRLGGLRKSQGRQGITVKYKRSPKKKYLLDDGSLSFDYELDGAMGGAFGGTRATMIATATAKLRFAKPHDIKTIQTDHQLLEDLFLLLTGTAFQLAWPVIRTTKNTSHTLYFWKTLSDTEQKPPKYFECVTNYLQLRDGLGSVWSRWKKLREELGPAIYLFLGASKLRKMYIEHRFVNLVWGLEAFHRRRHTKREKTARTEKINRIIEQVWKRDQKWLSHVLKHADEPALEERLFDTLRSVPLNIEEERLRKFATDCARLRNDISHFGESRRAQSYNEFMIDTDTKSDALYTFYHMLLLQEVGIDSSILKWWVYEGFRSYPIKYRFVQAGLLDEAVLRPTTT
jgi:hypothetical protein